MSYIGNKPTVGNFQICDAISVVNGQAAYTMQVGSVNVIPQSANHMIVSLNGTIQKPNSSFTVSGAVITFSSNLSTGDVIDFIQILGDVLDLGVPSDATVTTAKLGANSVTAAKLNNDIISGTTALTSEPADTDEFLVSDAGTLKRIDYSLIKGGGITEADQWRKSAVQELTTADVTTNLERVDDANYGKIGTGMSESSGVFSFPSTGTYMVMVNAAFYSTSGAGSSRYIILRTQITTNNSSYTNVAMAITNGYNFQNNVISQSASSTIFFNVTDTSTHKVKFTTSSATPAGYYLQGASTNNETMFTFIRMGDST